MLPPVADLYMADGPWPWTVAVRLSVLTEFLASAGMDLTQLRATTVPVAREVSLAGITVQTEVHEPPTLVTAPNVIGILEGTDSQFSKEYLVISAYMDRPATWFGLPDSTGDPGTGNAASVAGLVAVAKAFSQSGKAAPTLANLCRVERRSQWLGEQLLRPKSAEGGRRQYHG